MSWIDIAIIAVIVLSALVGVARGLIRELLSLAAWVAALALGWLYHKQIAELLVAQISEPSIRPIVAFVGIVLGVLILGAILGALLTAIIDRIGLTWIDRALGLFFGAARGVVVVALAVFLAGLTPLTDETWWKESQAVAELQQVADWMLSLVPPEVQARLKNV